jgi:quinol monooxygenase YgiN
MKKNSGLALFAMLIVGTTAVTGTYAFGPMKDNDAAQQALETGDYDAFMAAVESELPNKFSEERFEHMAERYESHQAIQLALDNGDYDAWVTAVEDAKPLSITEVITEDNFDTFIAMHEAREAGDFETAKQLAEELGFENGWNGNPGPMRMMGNGLNGHQGRMGMHGKMGGNCPNA